MGPSLDLVVRRTKLSSDDLYKRSTRVPKAAKVGHCCCHGVVICKAAKVGHSCCHGVVICKAAKVGHSCCHGVVICKAAKVGILVVTVLSFVRLPR